MSEPKNISRQMTLSAVVQAIITYGPVSRASVAKMTGFSKQTVSEIVSSLELDGWVQTVGRTQNHVGRRAVIYEIVPDAALVASVDLGGTKVRVALCNLSGVIVGEFTEPTCEEGGREVVGQIARIIKEMTAKLKISLDKVHVVVIGVPGVLNPQTGNILMAPNIKGIDAIDFPALMHNQIGVEVLVENDVNLAALGEHWMTHQGAKDDLVYLSVGTGIGAGLVIGGQLVRGATGAAGEIGYIPFGADPSDRESMKIGALERVTATGAMIAHYSELTGVQKTVPGIFEAALKGDVAAGKVLRKAANYIARTIGTIAAVIDPACVIIGGSIGSRMEFFNMVEDEIKNCFPKDIPLESSVLGNHAALAGGTSIALSRLHVALFSKGLSSAKIIVPPPEFANYLGNVA